MVEEQDWKVLGIIEKIQHKNWKARFEGYEGAIREINRLDSAKDPITNSYLGLIKNMVSDSNAIAHEKALEVVLVLIQKANLTSKVVNEISHAVVNKCLSSNRSKTKECGYEILKAIIEVEKHDVVMDELLNGLNAKTPKIVVGSILFLKECLHEFGITPKIMPIKELFKVIPKLLEDRDKSVREAGKELIIEIYLWLGEPALKTVLSQLKPVQVTELTSEFEKLSGDKPIPTRYLCSQKPKERSVSKPTGGGDAISNQHDNVDSGSKVDIDPYEFFEPVEVLSKIPGNFYEKVNDNKWTARKEVLEIVEKLTNHQRLVPDEYGHLLKAMLKIITKDTNVVLVVLAAKIIFQIANGLRQKYSPYAVNTIQVCLEKFKEKKANVVMALRDAIDSAFSGTTLETCIDDIEKALVHKSPSVKSETTLFLGRYFNKSSTKPPSKKILNQLMTTLIKQSCDSTLEVREASFQTIGVMMKLIPEKIMKPYLENIDHTKMARINEFYNKSKIGSLNLFRKPSISNRFEMKRSIYRVDNVPSATVQLPENSDIEIHDKVPITVPREKDLKRKISDFPENSTFEANDFSVTVVPTGSTLANKANDNNWCTDISLKSFNTDRALDSSKQPIIARNDAASFDDNDTKISGPTSFIRFAKMSKVPDKELIDNYKWLQQFDRKYEEFQRNVTHLSPSPLKRMIDNIHSENLATSCAASDMVNEWLSLPDQVTELMDQCASFLAVVSCLQIRLVSRKLTSSTDTNSEYVTMTTVMRNACMHLRQIIETSISTIDGEVILTILLVLLEFYQLYSNRCSVSTMSISVQTDYWVRSIITQIYKRTAHLPICHIVKLVALQIMPESTSSAAMKTADDDSVLGNIDLSHLIERLYDRYVRLPINDVSHPDMNTVGLQVKIDNIQYA